MTRLGGASSGTTHHSSLTSTLGPPRSSGRGRRPREAPRMQGRHEPTGAKTELDPKLEILEIFAKAKIDKIDNFWSRSG